MTLAPLPTVDPAPTAARSTRRSLLASALGAAAASIASIAAPRPSSATNGGSVILGQSAISPYDGTGTNESTRTTHIVATDTGDFPAFEAETLSSPALGAIRGSSRSTVGSGIGVSGTSGGSSGIGVKGTGVTGVIGEGKATGVKGTASDTSLTRYGVYGEAASTSGRGVFGWVPAASGTTYGIYGRAQSTSGFGGRGDALATTGSTYGLYGYAASTSGVGVHGVANASSGGTYGVRGVVNSTAGIAVRAEATASSGTTFGLYATSASTGGTGIHGAANAGSGSTIGINGQAGSPTGVGVKGRVISTAAGDGVGVWGESAAAGGTGVRGLSTATSGTSHGGWFESAGPVGAALRATNTYLLDSNGGTGIHASARGYGTAIRAESESGSAVSALTSGDYSEAAAINATSIGEAPALLALGGNSASQAATGVIVARSGNQNAAAIFGVSLADSGGTGLNGTATGSGGVGVRADGEFAVMAQARAAGIGVTGSSGTTGQPAIGTEIGILGRGEGTTGQTRGVVGVVSSPDGTGVIGSSGPTFPLPAPRARTGVYGIAAQGTSGVGVRGHSEEGTGLFGSSTTGTGLRASGRVRFDHATGTATIAAGTNSVVVTPGITLVSGSAVTATLMGNPGGSTTVQRVAVNTTDDTITIFLTANATADVKVGWHAFD